MNVIGEMVVRSYPSAKDQLIGLVVGLETGTSDDYPYELLSVYWCDNTYSFELPEELDTPEEHFTGQKI